MRTQHETWAIKFQIDTFSDAMPNQRHTTLISSSRFFRTLTIFPDILVLNQISLAPCGLYTADFDWWIFRSMLLVLHCCGDGDSSTCEP